MRRTLTVLIFIVSLLGLYLCFWPVPVEPMVWKPTTNPGYTGKFARNEQLEKFEKLSMGEFSGPEAAVIDDSGDVIATSHEGWLVKFQGGSGKAIPWVNLGGRPLGLDIDSQGNIWVANAYEGLQKITPSGQVTSELTEVDGTEIRYADDLAFAPNGLLYLSDATMRFPAEEWGGTYPASILDIVEHQKTGRIIEFDPMTQKASVIKADLSFANGVAAPEAGDFILVNETCEYRVWKIWITGEKRGEAEVILDALPGFPDNIARGLGNNFWVGIVSPRSDQVDALAAKPFWRRMLMRLPAFMRPKAIEYGMVLEIDETGKVIQNLQAPSGSLFTTTGAAEAENVIYITSLTAPFLGKVNKSDIRN